MLGMLPVLGVHAFEKAQRVSTFAAAPVLPAPMVSPVVQFDPEPAVPTEPSELILRAKAYEAIGSDTSQGFVVYSGSTVAADIGNSLSWSQRKQREDLLKTGVLQANGAVLRFTQDYVFPPPARPQA